MGLGGGAGWPPCLLNECCVVSPQLLGTFRCARAESEEGPLPITEAVATQLGCEETTLFGGPEARPELSTFLNARLMEEKLRNSPAKRAAGPPCKVTCENTKVKMKPGPLMSEAGTFTENMCP